MFTATGATLTEIRARGRKVVRKDGKQILLIFAGECVFAIANRCPHEGYPLSEGTLSPGCLLTCNWHNWKFDLRDGEAIVGSDPVRTYPVELRNEDIFIGLADPPAEAQRARALHGLDAAMADNDMAQMARLERAGFDACHALAHGIAMRNDHLEDGMTHAYAAASDWLMLAKRAPSPERRLTALLEPVAHLAEDTLGTDIFPYAESVSEWNAQSFVAAIEAEDEAKAVALVRGALAAGLTYGHLRPAFAEAALAHYADLAAAPFTHSKPAS
ncbi:MAG: Rieske (2Fe-2S) protein [Rhizomicrobium sp.]